MHYRNRHRESVFFIEIIIGAQYKKLISAVSDGKCIRTDAGHYRIRNSNDGPVARSMSVLVVDILHVVDVREHDRQRFFKLN